MLPDSIGAQTNFSRVGSKGNFSSRGVKIKIFFWGGSQIFEVLSVTVLLIFFPAKKRNIKFSEGGEICNFLNGKVMGKRCEIF